MVGHEGKLADGGVLLADLAPTMLDMMACRSRPR